MRLIKRFGFIGRPKVLIPLVVVLLAIASLVAAVRNLDTPAQGTITTPPGETSQPAAAPTGPKSYHDANISFKYPPVYSINPSGGDSSAVDNITLAASQPDSRLAALALARENLSNDSGVIYRKSHPGLYRVVSSALAAVVFSKLDGKEYTGFISHGDKVLSISITAVAPGDLSADYQQIAGSLEWPR